MTHYPPAPHGHPAPRRRVWPWVALGGVALLFVACSAAAVGAASTTTGAGTTTPAGSTPTATATAAEDPAAGFTAGVRLIGTDIPAGTYRTTGPDADDYLDLCYWARLSDTSGGFDALIANGTPQGPAVVTVKTSDAAFETTGSCVWALTAE